MPSDPLDDLSGSPVMPVAEARAGLSGLLREFRARGAEALPVVIGSHRKPEAVLVPYAVLGTLSNTLERTSEPVLDLLHRRKPLIERLARANRIRSVQVFGSVARGDETPESDVDLLVDPDPDASLFDLAQFELDLESLLDRPVVVVSRRALDPKRDRAVLAEAVDL
ncbi:nucleotidyltransferase domain-containing protein [Agromyces sp. GXQ0307]|uniref:nucleotidyltransferase domain-containing protein n=1 Tax=Agromyces sp. GXQ0307 TaxID=3377835 RepID=UPI003839FC0E